MKSKFFLTHVLACSFGLCMGATAQFFYPTDVEEIATIFWVGLLVLTFIFALICDEIITDKNIWKK